MKSKEIVQGWEIRCIKIDQSISNIIKSTGVSPSVASQWKRSNAVCPEAEIVQYLERNGVAFNLIANAVESVGKFPNRNRIFLTYIKVERAIREAEKAKALQEA